MLTLGIESSCDDTAAAVVEDGRRILSSVISSQDHIHERFGGVVPELASRRHLEAVVPIVNTALQRAEKTLHDIDLIAVTQGPGLIGSLLVGYSYAKALSRVSGIPFIGVDHMAGHLLSVFLSDSQPQFPYIALIVSGGNTSLFRCDGFTSFTHLGRSRDDAAGEAFDKVAKLLSLGYPGGPAVSLRAQNGNPDQYAFPRSWLEDGSLDSSFSGLKTAVLLQVQKMQTLSDQDVSDICASFEKAVVEVLVSKTVTAALQQNVNSVVVGGGVSANLFLRDSLKLACQQHSLDFHAPPLPFCTDNGAMIALAGYHGYSSGGEGHRYDSDVFSRSQLG